MKKYSQLHKVVSILLINILLIQTSGCYSTKVISNSDLPVPRMYKYTFIIHFKDSEYLLENTVISNGVLSGNIDIEKESHKGNKIHVYLPSDSTLKINIGEVFSIPTDNIVKVETVTFIAATIGCVGLSSIGLILILLYCFWDGGGFVGFQ